MAISEVRPSEREIMEITISIPVIDPIINETLFFIITLSKKIIKQTVLLYYYITL